jgi:LmbE family N-acetylglucosaminyl deacetylase
MSRPVEFEGSEIVLRRPHFRLVGDDLFFLISRRPYVRLSADEMAVWEALDGDVSVDTLRARFPVTIDPVLRRFAELEICEIVPTDYPKSRRRVLIFEPHADDAVLSVGGTMWLRRYECEFTIVTIASRSNFTSYYDLDRDYFDVDQVSTLRSAEGALVARLLGGRHRALDQPEATLRYQGGNWSLDWYRRHKISVSAFIAHHSGSAELQAWAEAIHDALGEEASAEVWFPLGSPHTDHELVRDAFLLLLRENRELFAGREIRLYQDVPYAARFPDFTPIVVDGLTRMGAHLTPEIVPIASVFDAKLRLVSLYASQFKLEAVRADIEASAHQADRSGGLVERFWHINQMPETLEPLSLRADELIVQHAAERLAPWVLKHRNAKRIRLLLLMPAGRWAKDMEYLLDVFPEATVEAYIASAAAAEVANFDSPRVSVRHVDSGTKTWVLLGLRLILMGPAPTLFLAGEKRLREARFLSALWPMSDPIVLPTMDHLVSGLQRLASASASHHIA